MAVEWEKTATVTDLSQVSLTIWLIPSQEAPEMWLWFTGSNVLRKQGGDAQGLFQGTKSQASQPDGWRD